MILHGLGLRFYMMTFFWTFCKKNDEKSNDLKYHYAGNWDRIEAPYVKHVDAKAEFAELKETMQKLEDFELRQDIILEKRIEQDK